LLDLKYVSPPPGHPWVRQREARIERLRQRAAQRLPLFE
jgi:hypothetical protein